jgi:hypothetical protein
LFCLLEAHLIEWGLYFVLPIKFVASSCCCWGGGVRWFTIGYVLYAKRADRK